MGYTSWSDDANQVLSRSYKTKSTNQVFTQNVTQAIANDMSPVGVQIRESRDSDNHPTSLAVAVFLDITGSMGRIPELIIRNSLGNLMNTLVNNGIEHPQVLFGAIGDHYTDKAKLQIGQFESGADELHQWLKSIWIEGNGGGQRMESYLLAWHFAAQHTSIDCFEKRGEKGFLVTIGDEASHGRVEADALKAIFGYGEASDITDREVFAEASRKYHIYHIHVQEGSYANEPGIIGYWRDLLGERLILLDNHEAISETIASLVGVLHGIELDKLTKQFAGSIGSSVHKALVHVTTAVTGTQKSGIIKP